MRAVEVNMEWRRNERAGETGDPQDNPPTNGIVRHNSHLRKSRDPGIVPDDAVVAGFSRGSPDFLALSFRRCFILTSPSSALKTLMLRAAQISSLTPEVISSREAFCDVLIMQENAKEQKIH
ncbi:hypothetical protein PR048_024691 [Dryococelus australis]|uniref:Uncharacterized protein n=1 Tax=Dryococelus australis TaxID=614101 RepID=A0ABQ9GP96_9NEOP|nr:hypothetical protein PR048_024691 [Dryococelus australis]